MKQFRPVASEDYSGTIATGCHSRQISQRRQTGNGNTDREHAGIIALMYCYDVKGLRSFLVDYFFERGWQWTARRASHDCIGVLFEADCHGLPTGSPRKDSRMEVFS